MENKFEKYSTMDVYVSAFLLLCGIEPELEKRQGKVVFIFSTRGDFYKLLMRYNSNVAVPVADFTVAVKTLRGRMLNMR